MRLLTPGQLASAAHSLLEATGNGRCGNTSVVFSFYRIVADKPEGHVSLRPLRGFCERCEELTY